MNKSFRKWTVCSLAVSLVVFFFSACKTVDYAYRHHVSGRVIDAATSKPVPDVLVRRVFAEQGDQDSGPAMYRQQTDESGRFLFHYSGLGGKPTAKQQWTLKLSHNDYADKTVRISISWRQINTNSNQSSYGYVKNDLLIKMQSR